MIIKVATDILKRHWSPFDSRSRPWSLQENRPISISEVQRAVSLEQLVSPEREEHFKYYGKRYRELHVRRIAWFVVNGVVKPISIYVCPFLKDLTSGERWIITDGNHRLAAAIVRNDSFVPSSIRGNWVYAEKLLSLDFGSPEGIRYG